LNIIPFFPKIEKDIYVTRYACVAPEWDYVAYQLLLAYNKCEKINIEGGGISSFMYLNLMNLNMPSPIKVLLTGQFHRMQ